MKNNLIEIGKRFNQLKSNMLHGGYTRNMSDNYIIDILSDEILSELGEIEKYDDVKKSLINMFFIGQLSNNF
jgi:hypothetical protein